MRSRTQRPHRDWDRTVFEYLLKSYRSVVDSCRGRNSVCNRPGYGIGLWRMLPLTPSEPPELTQDWENRLLEGTNKTLYAPGPRRKEQCPHKRLTQTCLRLALESPLDGKETQPVNPKGNQTWIFTGRTDCWSWNYNTLSHLIRRTDSLERPWCWERLKVGGKGDDRGWDGWIASRTLWTWVWFGDGQGSLACCSPWGHKEPLNWYDFKEVLCIELNSALCQLSHLCHRFCQVYGSEY